MNHKTIIQGCLKTLAIAPLMSTYNIWNTRKGALCKLQTKQALISLYAQADPGLCCRLTESVHTVVYVDKQKVPRLDCTDAHADLDLHCYISALFCVLCIICFNGEIRNIFL